MVGFRAPHTATGTLNFIISHITAYSQASPFTSFTTSYAIARGYALAGPGGLASQGNPGYVYQVDLQQLATPGIFRVFDPVASVVHGRNGSLVHDHNGDAGLLPLLVAGLASPAPPVQGRFGKTLPLRLAHELQVLVNALRDAEVLVEGSLPSVVVTGRDDVY